MRPTRARRPPERIARALLLNRRAFEDRRRRQRRSERADDDAGAAFRILDRRLAITRAKRAAYTKGRGVIHSGTLAQPPSRASDADAFSPRTGIVPACHAEGRERGAWRAASLAGDLGF